MTFSWVVIIVGFISPVLVGDSVGEFVGDVLGLAVGAFDGGFTTELNKSMT